MKSLSVIIKKTRNLSVAKIHCNKVLFSTDAVYCAGNFSFRVLARNLGHNDDLLGEKSATFNSDYVSEDAKEASGF